MNVSEFNPADGLLLVCERDDAKRLFGAKSDETLVAFFDEVLSDPAKLNYGRALGLRSKWLAIHACFCDGDTDRTAGSLPLNQIILGGRPLGSGDHLQATFVRPDLVPHIVSALCEFGEEDVNRCLQVYNSNNPEGAVELGEIRSLIEAIRKTFEVAASLRAAVVFYQRER